MAGIKVIDKNGNMKGIDFSDYGGIDGFLAVSSNGSATNAAQLRKVVPWLQKAITMTGNAVAQLPVEFKRGETDVDPPTVWGAVTSPQTLMYKLASSLCSGAAYALIDTSSKALLSMQYMAPQTIQTQFGKDGEVVGFKRSINGSTQNLSPEQVVYVWLPDDTVETGPAQITPITNAMRAAGLLAAMEGTLTTYAQRGFIPPMFGVAENITEPEMARAESVLSKFVSGSWERIVKIIRSKGLVPQPIGAGMEELRGTYQEITDKQIENIAASFSIPLSLFRSNAANYATALSDRRLWYESGLFVTLYQTIEDAMTQQLWSRFGIEMNYLPESLDAFQEEENDKSGSLSSLSSTFEQYPEASVIAADILGYDLTDEQRAAILALDTEEDVQDPEPQPVPPQLQPYVEPTDIQNEMAGEMQKWLDFEKKRKGKKAYDTKVIKHLPAYTVLNIQAGLIDAAGDLDKIDRVFADASKELPLITLARAIEGMPLEVVHKSEPVTLKLDSVSLQQPPDLAHVIEVLKQAAPVVNVHPELKADAPVVNFTMPDIPAPVVNITNEVQTPSVTVTNDVQPADVKVENVVNVEDKPRSAKVKRDARGFITGLEEEK